MLNWLYTFCIAGVGGLIALKVLALLSQKRSAAYGLIKGRLAPKNHLANCVSSEGEGANISPLTDFDAQQWSHLKHCILSQNGKILTQQEDYLHATFRTALFGFEDDLEVRFDRSTQTLHFRSSSRIGYSDMGTNEKRVDLLKSLIE